MTEKILVIDDETHLLRFFEYNIKGQGFEVFTGETGAEMRRLIGEHQFATVLLDLMLPDANGLDLLDELHEQYPSLPVILITAYGTIDKAVAAMKAGAFDFVAKPVDIDRLNALVRNAVEQHRLRREVHSLRRRLDPPREFHGMVGSSEQMIEIYTMIESVAPTKATVMITGESGTGKELVAHAIHDLSGRAEQPFLAINCAAIPRDLLESELFGHEEGSFTGAIGRRAGCFERANTGTLFLDEIAEMDLGLQAKLLRLLQEQVFYRVGGTHPIKVDVRIIAATNKEPGEAVRAGKFREDLFYRLNVVPIKMPPLRERREDIGLIAAKFLLEYAQANGRGFQGFELEALAAMERYPWAGNVRELRNIVEQVVVLNDGERVTLEMLPAQVRQYKIQQDGEQSGKPATAGEAAVREAAALRMSDEIHPFWQTERNEIQRALDISRGNVQDAARKLEISPATMYRKIEKYGLVK